MVGAEGEIVGKRMKDGSVYAAGPQRYTGAVVANMTEMSPDGVVKGALNGANVPAFSVTEAEVLTGLLMVRVRVRVRGKGKG